MFVFLVFVVVVAAAVLLLRRWLLTRESRPPQAEPFDGVVYRVGEAAVAERRVAAPRATVICMHGFVENLKYFTAYYNDPDVQLILVNSGDYHLPIANPRYEQAPWAKAPGENLGTIRYDAEVLVQALEHLPKSDTIRVHGHSRGGAVALEAAALRPDLFEKVEVVLEAPVLPQARTRQRLSERQRWFMPFFLVLWSRSPINDRNRKLFGRLDDPRKRTLIAELPFNGKHTSTLLINQRDIQEWMESRETAIYRNVSRGVVLVPDKDKILDTNSMKASAEQAQGRLAVVEIDDCSHFVLYDRPDVLPPLAASRAAREPVTS